jgi:histidyl-tRNA synthetase
MAGDDERAKNILGLKDYTTGEQHSFSLDEVITKLK